MELVKFAKTKSIFFGELYKNINENNFKIEDLPLTNLNEFWKCNQIQNNSVLTGPIVDGIIFKSGGTTGNPKFSVFSREEWSQFTQFFGAGMGLQAIQSGDRIANLFYAGDLYSSFLFIHGALERSYIPTVNFPISGSVSGEHLAELIQEHSINVLAGVPTTILNYAEKLRQLKIKFPSIKKIIFGGESLFPDQRLFLESVFPGVKIVSIGYASVDGGLLGYADSSCEVEEHRGFSEATIMEIINEEGKVINETDTPGELYVTSLTRSLMPIIRYPAGDRAVWKEGPGINRKFKLMGRSGEAARVGPVSVYFEDVARLLKGFKQEVEIQAFQLILEHQMGKDRLIIRIATQGRNLPPDLKDRFLQNLYTERPMLAELSESKFIENTVVDFVEFEKLEINPRTGKLKRVLDRRLSAAT